MKRTILALLACSVLSPAQPSPQNVTATYRFTTPQTPQSFNEAMTVVKTVAAAPQVSVDAATAIMTFSGPAEAVDFAAWHLPQIDRPAGDNAVHEYKLPSGDIGRVNFVSNLSKPQEVQELLTILRTVADVQKIYTVTSNHAIAMRAQEWQISFSEWIINLIDQPVSAKPDTTPREFTVGGPDYRGMGHGARLNFLASMSDPRQSQELLTVLRTVGDVQKVFSYTASHALVMRAGDTDLQRAQWIIQQLDLPANQPGVRLFTAPAGDDVTRVFRMNNTTPQWLQTAVTALRSDLKIKHVFSTTQAATIVVRGTADQIAAALAWMTSHNALPE